MGLGVPVPAKPNIWVIVFVHGVGFWQIEEGSLAKIATGLGVNEENN